MTVAELRTERLVLRDWRDGDREPFAALNADPRVMEHFPARLTRMESDAMVDRIVGDLRRQGWGLWAVTHRDEDRFLGFTGLLEVTFEAPFTPAIEIGWRYAAEAWGHGFATEAARAALGYAFSTLALDEIVSMTAQSNVRSQRVMERLGMKRDPTDDFDHPLIVVGHRLRRHVLYRLTRRAWEDQLDLSRTS
jgi:RimJ/RimL family protein N-acetyltransferase